MRLRTAIVSTALLMLWGAGAAAATDAASLARGKYLVEGVVACGNCHIARGAKGEPLFDKGLSGGMAFDDPAFNAVASNITPDMETGIGKWTDAQLAKAIREGIRPDKSVIGPPMPIAFYRHFSDSDLAAIIAYLRAQPPVKNPVAKSRYNIALPPAYGPPITSVKSTPASNKRAYGEYLANIGHCMECHTPRDDKGMLQLDKLGAGGQKIPGPWGESVSRNLTPHPTDRQGRARGGGSRRQALQAADGICLLQEHQRRRHGGTGGLPAFAQAADVRRQVRHDARRS
jgi:mono/diheme cytochrome c family protein